MPYVAPTLDPQMPSHNSHCVSTVRPEQGAKNVRKESNELEILKLLNTIQPKREHVISLLDLSHTQSGP
jgi:hypothetical protein